MYYLFGSSFVWVILFLVGMIYLNSKINRLYDRLDKLTKEGGIRASTPPSLVVPTSPGTVAADFGVTGQSASLADLAGGVPSPSPVSPSDVRSPSFNKQVNTEEKGGQWIGKIGVLSIVLGVSFFLKWAFENDLIGPMGRIMLGIVGGVAFVVVGQLLRKKYLVYSDIVSGGGIAILYLSIFAAFAFYHFIGQGVAMGLMFLITALSVTLSVLGGTQHLAVLGIIGGIATPALVSSGGNNFAGLMGYLTILDLGILGVAIFKKWNRLNLLGFIGTVLWFYSWYESYYKPANLPEVFLVLSIFFLIYLIAGIVHNVLWKQISPSEDLFLITLNAALYALGAYAILNPLYHGVMGFFMFFLALLYFLVAFVAYRMNSEDTMLNVYLPGIAIVFLTLAMPIQFSGKWITLAWLIEAAVLTATGSLARRHSMNLFGAAVFAVGLVRFFTFDLAINDIFTFTPIFNARFFLGLSAVVVAYLMGYMFVRHLGEGDENGRKEGAMLFFVVANLLSIFMLTSEITTHYEKALAIQTQQFSSLRTDVSSNGGSGLSERIQDEFRQKEISFYQEQQSTRNRSNTVISIVWSLYAAVLTAIGFGMKRRLVRLFGLILFFVTAFKVLINVWALGEVYRIISAISFGVIALVVSFVYAKWRHRLQEVL